MYIGGGGDYSCPFNNNRLPCTVQLEYSFLSYIIVYCTDSDIGEGSQGKRGASGGSIYINYSIQETISRQIQYSRTSIIRPSIIRNLDYPAWQFSCYQIRKWGGSLKRACALQLLPWRHACLSFAHAQTTMWHCCLSIKWVDQGVVYLFDYPAYSLIRPASGTKVSG